MGQWIIILALALIGQFVSDLISFPIPKTIIASIILFLLLEFKVVKADYFKGILAVCKKHLAFLFLPVGVGIMTQLNSRPIMDYVKVLFMICKDNTKSALPYELEGYSFSYLNFFRNFVHR